MPSLVDRLAKNIFQKATVIYKQQVTPHMYHLRLQGEAFKTHHYIPGEHVRLFVGLDQDTGLDSKVRTYSIWDHDSTLGTIELAMCTHSSGIGAAWIHRVTTGEDIYYMGPKGKLTIDPQADAHLMISDASALSHMYAIRRYSSGLPVRGIAYADTAQELYADLDGSKPFTFLTSTYDPIDAIIGEVELLKVDLPQNLTIYIGGDARVCKTLSRYFRQNWPDARVISKGFWMPGKTGMD